MPLEAAARSDLQGADQLVGRNGEWEGNMRCIGSRLVASFVGYLLCAPISAQVTQRVNIATGGTQGNGHSCLLGFPSISSDGRYVAFPSDATNLVPGDTNNRTDIFIHDRQAGATDLVSVDSAGVQGNDRSFNPSISADGRFVAFASLASNLIPGDTNGVEDIFVRDRQLGTTELVSIDSGGSQGNNNSFLPSISADGRYVAFASSATNLVSGGTTGIQIFVHDRQSGTTALVSVDSSGSQGYGGSNEPVISADGRYVSFDSEATNLVSGDTNGVLDVFVHDRISGTTDRVSVDSGGAQATFDSYTSSISGDGRYVAFYSLDPTLAPGDTNGVGDVFVHDRQTGTTELASVNSGGLDGDQDSSSPSISADGRYVAFSSGATNLVPGDTGFQDIFVRDRQFGTTERVSIDSGGGQGNGNSYYPSISTDGRYVGFGSDASNLVSADTNGYRDVFVRDRAATGFTSLCDPGVGGVIACPFANPPNGSGRGCNNFAATGGAALSASGIAYLSMDSLVFATSNENPTVLSVLLQGTSLAASGLVYGRGVRCVGGVIRPLFKKAASGGSITAPDFSSGDPTVSARSASIGDVIQPGQSRWYLVYYRDPAASGGYLGTSTFNATQTGQVTWWP